MKIFLLLILVSFSVNAQNFHFDHNEEEWGQWGEGLGGFQSEIGHTKRGSLWLSTDYGESHTAHYRWSSLKPGNYRVTTWVRAENVQSGAEGTSFWHFYDTGTGTQNVFTDLAGSYEWRKVEYTINVKKSELSIWFRLKSPGKVWIDDFTIEKVNDYKSIISIAPPTKLKDVTKKNVAKLSKEKRTILFNFDKDRFQHPFSVVANKQNNKMGKFSSREYINFDVQSILSGNWKDYDRLELEIFNNSDLFYEFYLTLMDDKSGNYWTQLNHKSHLAPGWNKLSLSLKQFIGERGSHRYHRPLDLTKLQKFFIVVDPDKRLPVLDKIYIDNVSIQSSPPPLVPKEILAFDFTSHKSNAESPFTKVTSQDLYDAEKGYGFVNPEFWRIEDSQYASEVLRYSIGILKGKFKIKLPDGKYKISLIMDKLGFWDTPFWRNRTVYANAIPLFKEARGSANDYLTDLLQFESIVPLSSDHPHDLYLSKVFNPKEGTVNVTDGTLELEFEGDASGISLNSLLIWKVQDEKIARTFQKEIKKRDRQEFDWMARKIVAKETTLKTEPFSLVGPELTLSPDGYRPSIGQEINLFGGAGERPFQLIQIAGASDISWTISPLKNQSGTELNPELITLNELVYQYTSPDLNHESYMIVGKYFKPILSNQISFPQEGTRYLSFQVQMNDSQPAGKYKGSIAFKSGGKEKKFPIVVDFMPYKLPKIDFPVGFFGLDPIPHTYFDDPGLKALRQRYRMDALQKIAESGFTTFTGLPSIKTDWSSGILDLDTADLDEIFLAAKEYGLDQPVFSYGGQFPNELLDESLKPNDMSSNEYHSEVATVLQKVLAKPFWPKIVHTFSDEAGGYSDRVKQDLEKGLNLKRHYPFLPLGGFSSMTNASAKELNKLFDYGFYSHVTKNGAVDKKRKWGSYNASPGNLNDPRFTFGPGLYMARQKGLSQYLEWHLTGFNNFPYYDLDGRESDVSMFMPTLSGELLPTLRFELATEGLQSFRKLQLLKELISKKEGSTVYLTEARKWMDKQFNKNKYLENDSFLSGRGQDFPVFQKELNRHLSQLMD